MHLCAIMRDRTRAHNFVQAIIEKFAYIAENQYPEENEDEMSLFLTEEKDLEEIIDYLAKHDIRNNRQDSYAYNELLEYFKPNKSIYSYIKKKLMNK